MGTEAQPFQLTAVGTAHLSKMLQERSACLMGNENRGESEEVQLRKDLYAVHLHSSIFLFRNA